MVVGVACNKKVHNFWMDSCNVARPVTVDSCGRHHCILHCPALFLDLEKLHLNNKCYQDVPRDKQSGVGDYSEQSVQSSLVTNANRKCNVDFICTDWQNDVLQPTITALATMLWKVSLSVHVVGWKDLTVCFVDSNKPKNKKHFSSVCVSSACISKHLPAKFIPASCLSVHLFVYLWHSSVAPWDLLLM